MVGLKAILAAVAAGIVLGAAPSAQAPPQKPEQQVIRATTNLIQVDAYPTRDGQIVEGLTARDFQVFEDGKPQAIETIEFVRIEPNTPEALRVDPNTRDEANKLAADPRNRVFVLFLDHYHGTLAGSFSVRLPIITMLNRMIAPNDLFGIWTPLMGPRDLILGRQTTSVEDQLTRHWNWGKQDGTISFEPEEENFVRCYGQPVALEIVSRLREKKTLESLSVLVRHLGNLRDARKALLVFTGGWQLRGPDPARINQLLNETNYGKKDVYVGPGGTLTMKPPTGHPDVVDWGWCAAELGRTFMFDAHKRYREVIDEAIRANVVFYPINVNGLAVSSRQDMFIEMADNTDGIPVITNDLTAGLKRVADDMSAFYLLGYYSPLREPDGRYHQIEVKVNAPGVAVKARRGWSSNAALPPPDWKPDVNKPATPAGVTAALEVLARLRPNAELFTYGVVTSEGVRLTVELPSSTGPTPEWDKGGTVQFTRTDQDGLPPIVIPMEAGTRSAMVIDMGAKGDGPFRYSVRVGNALAVVNERMEVVNKKPTVVGEPVLYRAAPSPAAPLRPVANFQFWRTERIVIEWPILTPLDNRSARLLGRDGRPLPIPVNVTQREKDGRPVLTAGANLAPLAQGDYVFELSAASGQESIQRYVAVRLVR